MPFLRRIRDRAYARERHIWFRWDLAGRQPAPRLPDGLRLVRADDDQLGAVAR